MTKSASEQPTDTVPRRLRKRLRTRSEIENAALRLFLSRGFANVTVQDIAAAADVDPATFWRHFASKEAVLFPDTDAIAEQFRAAIKERPSSETPIEAAFEAVASIFREQATNVALLQSRSAIAAEVPSVAAHMAVLESQLRDLMAEALAERMAVPLAVSPAAYIIAGIILSSGHWFRTQHARDGNWSVEEAERMTIAALSELKEMF